MVIPPAVARFLSGPRLAVAGVSRKRTQPANAVFKKLRASGLTVYPISLTLQEMDGVRCYPTVSDLPDAVDGVVVATHPRVAADVVRACGEAGVGRIWFHRSFGDGSVSDEAVQVCAERGIDCIIGGCPLMFCEPVDIGHRCMRWWLQRHGRVPR